MNKRDQLESLERIKRIMRTSNTPEWEVKRAIEDLASIIQDRILQELDKENLVISTNYTLSEEDEIRSRKLIEDAPKPRIYFEDDFS